ncbi:siderophore-interacting protein [Asanoa iriomotensis]|uniref:Siderophore-interacting protein n=1 Tax=Asanoa iriomotensis TaxID=234613 RepID=A0ABQ4C0U3_9ACTN|nr:siderophore-interacting protein [Asanoa iriomotensis]GIF56382.1 siderophore-interacting protein [Asanoa iriomotensis]
MGTRAQYVLTVESTERLTPHLVRVVATSPSLADFADNGHTDAYVKLVFVDPALGLEPPYDLAALRATLPREQLPVVRTYTVRWVDRSAGRLAIDFVTHGDTGVAAPWAMKAVPGDRLVLSGPGGAYAPDPAVGWHVLVGDLSALPAIAAALESMRGDARGVAHLEIGDEAEIVDLKCPEQVTVNWLVNPSPDDTGFLARALDAGPWPDGGGVHVFAHGERESVKAIRAVLRTRGVPRESISISGYWARGRTEDAFQAEKREPIGKID